MSNFYHPWRARFNKGVTKKQAKKEYPQVSISESHTYIIEGEPVLIQKETRDWDQYRQDKFNFVNSLAAIHDDKPLFQGPLHVEITFYLSVPKSVTRKTQEDKRATWHHGRPMLDRMFEFVEKACAGTIYQDSAQICSLVCRKYYSGAQPYTQIVVSPISLNEPAK